MELQIPPGRFAAFIFDLDGTLVDSMPLHYRAWDRVLREHGLHAGMDERLFHSLSGAAPLEFTAAVGRQVGRELDGPALLEAKNAVFAALQPAVEVIPATVDLARRAAATHRLAVASGGAREVVLGLLEAAGLRELFPVVVGGDEVARGKPAPDLFLEAARRLGVAPAECLVFEDAAPGLVAAEAAGMKWVRVFPPSPRGA
jgi:HAD superfamily hydrolase (TIGR01509 family)